MGSARRLHRTRSEVRLTVDIEVSIRRYREPVQHLLMSDVSTAGALITGDFDRLAKGDEIILRIGRELSIVATVAWTTEKTLGLAFHRRLDDFEFNAVLATRTRPGVSFDTQSFYRLSVT